jgi:hypothetical protein
MTHQASHRRLKLFAAGVQNLLDIVECGLGRPQIVDIGRKAKRRQVETCGSDTMSKATQVLRNSLILLAWGAAIPAAAWSAETLAPGTSAPPESKVHFSVPFQASNGHVLDLKAPDIRNVMTADELAAATAMPSDGFETIGPETVAVHGVPQPVYVPSGFAALYWAAIHPLSAWRILAPVQ